jgi:hypothetical protein
MSQEVLGLNVTLQAIGREQSTCLALSGHPNALSQCPLLGVKQTSAATNPMSAFDPKRTLVIAIPGEIFAPQHEI